MLRKFIIPNTDSILIEMLTKASDIVEEIIGYNENALLGYADLIERNQYESPPYYKLAVLQLWRGAIEIVESIKTLIRGNSCHSIGILLRTLFEFNLAVGFIYSDPTLTQKRAAAYIGVHLLKQQEELSKFSADDCNKDFQECIGLNIVQEIAAERNIAHEINVLQECFDRYPELKEVQQEYARVRCSKQGRKKKGKVNVEWYELFRGQASISKLAELQKKKSIYLSLYHSTSRKVHAIGAMYDWRPDSLKNPKIPDLKQLASEVDWVLTLLDEIGIYILKEQRSDLLTTYKISHLRAREYANQFCEEVKKLRLLSR